MKISNINSEKRSYKSPEIECVQLDNEISLVMESGPAIPNNGDEVYNNYFNNDPFKKDLG